MPWKTLCGFPPTRDEISLRIPNGAWRPDTVITDYDGNEMFVLLDQVQEMRTYEAIFGDLDGRRLVCIKRHMIQAFWKDGFYFCTYRPNYLGQKPLEDRDMDNKKLFPFSYLQISSMKGRFFYCCIDNHEELEPPRLMGENPWLGFMVVFCTPMIRCGNWSLNIRRYGAKQMVTKIDQWKNLVTIGSGQDLLAGLCMAYVFDRFQCQPFVTCWGEGLEDRGADDFSISSSSSEDSESDEDDENSTTMSKASKRRKKARKDAAQSEAEKIDAETYKGPGPPKPGEAYPDQNDPTQHNPNYHRGYRGGTSYQEVNQDDDFDKDDYYDDDDEEKNKDESDQSEVILFEQDDAYTAGGGTTTGGNNNNNNNTTPLYEQGNIPEGDEEGGEQEQYHDEDQPQAGGGAAAAAGGGNNDNDDQSSYLLAPAAQPNPNAKSSADQPFGMALGSVH